MGLVAAELERQGISTVAVQLLRTITEEVCPPRALVVPYRHGFPLGRPNDPEQQHAVIRAALDLLKVTEAEAPYIVDYVYEEEEQRVLQEVAADE